MPEEDPNFIYLSREIVNKAIGFHGHDLKLENFVDQFERVYGISITVDEAACILAVIEDGKIPRAKIFGMAVVLLQERF